MEKYLQKKLKRSLAQSFGKLFSFANFFFLFQVIVVSNIFVSLILHL